MTTKLSRRALLHRSIQIPIGVASIAALASCSGGANTGAPATSAGNICAGVETMDENARALRRSLHYTEISPDQNAACGQCAYFHSGASGCGTCDIYSGGPANSRGHCDSWSKRSA